MATITTLKIGSAASGRDFPTVNAAWASTPNDWVAADVAYIFEMYNDSEFVPTAVWNFTGRNMDATHNLVVRPAAGQGFKDNPNLLTNALRYNQANGVAVNFNFSYATHITVGDYVTVDGLQIKSAGVGGACSVSVVGTTTTGKLNNSLIEFSGNNSYARAIQVKSGSARNTYVILTGLACEGLHFNAYGVSPYAENITVVRLSNLAAPTMPAYGSDIAGAKLTNCAGFGCSAFSTRSDFTGSNNASDGNILFGINNKTNLVYSSQFIDTVADFKVKAGSGLIDAGTAPSTDNITTISGVRQQGTSADIGAWETPSSIQAPTATVTNVATTNQNVVITGTTTGSPTSGTASLAVTAMAYNSGVAQGPVNLTFGSGTFTATFPSVTAGRYSLSFSVANAYYNIAGTNPLGTIDVVGPQALSLVQDDVTPGQILTIHGTVQNATSGQLIVPASVSNPGVASPSVAVTINTSVTPNTFTVSTGLAPGTYDAPILLFTGPGGTSLPQSGTQGVVVVGPRALTVVQDPVDGQTLTIHGTVEKATAGQLVVPADATNPNGAITQTVAVTIDTTVTPNTYTVSVDLPGGNYDAPILTFSNYLGSSQPQLGTSAVSIMAISGYPQAPMPDTTVAADTTPPVMVGSLTVTGITSNGYTVSWQAATDNASVAGYEIATDGVNYAPIGNVLTYTTSSANPSSTYNVKVRAVDTSSNKSDPLNAIVTTLAAVDATPPVMTGAIAVSNVIATQFDIAWQAATDNVAVSGYEYSLNSGTWVDVGTNLTTSVVGVTANTTYTVQVRAYDPSGNRSVPLSTTVKTANYVQFNGFTPSVARTISVKSLPPLFTGGKWWTLTDIKRPRGLKDPDAIIDITFDWTDWLADIGGPTVSAVTFTLNGLSSVGTFSDGDKTTVFVAGGTAGSSAAVSCMITTYTNPPRTDQRTVYIDIAEE
jgi:chitodextrinase